MSDSVPVDIEFVLKNVNLGKEAAKVKEEIVGIGEVSEKVTNNVEKNFTDAFNRASVGAAGVNNAFNKGAAGALQFAKGNQQLSYSMQQVARELPSLAISPQLFFLAISNNLPILQDNIRKVRLENEALKASGATTVPVWRQLVSSLFSWQTALVAGITIITVYGKEIFNWIGNLIKSKNALNEAKKAMQEFKETTASGIKNIQGEITKLDLLYSAATNVAKGTKERNDAVTALQKIYPDFLGNIDAEVLKTGKAVTAYQNLRKAIIDSAIAKAYQDKITESQSKIVDIETELDPLIKKYDEQITEVEKAKEKVASILNEGGKENVFKLGTSVRLSESAQAELGQLSVQINEKKNEIEKIKKQIEKYSSSINISDLLFNDENKSKGQKKAVDELKKAEDALTAAVIKGDQKEIDFLAAKVALLRKELELRQWIADEAIAFAQGKVTQAQRDWEKNPTTISSKAPGTDFVGKTKTVKGVQFEITAIDKTGPIWKKVQLEGKKLAEQVKDNAKKAAKDQEKLDDEAFDRKQRMQEDLLNYSRQFTGELINQLGLTQEQNAELQGIADTVFNLASGDYIAAAFSAVATIITTIANAQHDALEGIAQAYSLQNRELEKNIELLKDLRGEEKTKKEDEIRADYEYQLKLLNQRAQQTDLVYKNLLKVWGFVIPTLGGITKEEANNVEHLITLLNDPVLQEKLALGEIKIKNFDDIEALINDYDELQRKMEEFETTAKEVPVFSFDSAKDALKNLLLDVNTTLAKVAENFQESMRQAIVGFIIDGNLKQRIQEWYNEFTAAMSDEELTKKENEDLSALWESIYSEGRKKIEDAYRAAGIEKPAGAYAEAQGIFRNMSEDTGSLLVGQFSAIRTDIKSILAAVAQGDEVVQQRLAYLRTIANNTSHNVRLVTIEQELKTMNKTLVEKLS